MLAEGPGGVRVVQEGRAKSKAGVCGDADVAVSLHVLADVRKSHVVGHMYLW